MRPSELLAGEHRLDGFDSGEPALDDWLRRSALDAQVRGTARTFVVLGDDGALVGYYAIVAHVLQREGLPSRIGRGNPAQIPAVLLARLAVDRRRQGRGFGGTLLADALARIVLATRTVAARYVVVDALHEKAADFYAHYGFARVPGTSRLVRKLTDVAADLDL